MRITFLDEAGRSRQETVIVVGGIIINGDRTYRAIEQEIRDIAVEYLPEADRRDFVRKKYFIALNTSKITVFGPWSAERQFCEHSQVSPKSMGCRSFLGISIKQNTGVTHNARLETTVRQERAIKLLMLRNTWLLLLGPRSPLKGRCTNFHAMRFACLLQKIQIALRGRSRMRTLSFAILAR